MQLRGLGLALERAQPRARLALHVERAGEVLLGALELQLRAAAALAVLAEPGGLLDQQPPVARLRVHDRLDPALGDDRVHLLAEAGVGQHLDHVGQPAARAVEAVLALAGAVEPAQDRDLREVACSPAPPSALSMTTSTSAALEPLTPWPPAKITSFIVWPRTASGLCSPSAHSTASVMFDLPEPFGPDDHADAGRELELGAVREGLEALHRDRPEVHQASPSSPSSAARARAARPPARRPSWSGPSPARARGRRPRRPPRSSGRAAGPPRSDPVGRRPRRAGPAAPGARDLWSTGFSSASSIWPRRTRPRRRAPRGRCRRPR